MKKIISVALLLIMAFSLTSCVKKTHNYKLGLLRLNNVDEEKFGEKVSDAIKKIEGEASTKYKNVRYLWYDDINVALLALDRGDIDSFITNKSSCNYIKACNPNKYKIVEDDKDALYCYAMATKVENTDLLNKLNYAIDALIKNGTLMTLQAKYLNTTNIIDDARLPHYKDAPTYKVVVTGDLPPMDYVSADGHPMGFNIALLSEISKILEVNIELVQASSGARKLMLSTGKADILFWVANTKSKYYDDNFESDLTSDMASTTVYNTQQICGLEKIGNKD